MFFVIPTGRSCSTLYASPAMTDLGPAAGGGPSSMTLANIADRNLLPMQNIGCCRRGRRELRPVARRADLHDHERRVQHDFRETLGGRKLAAVASFDTQCAFLLTCAVDVPPRHPYSIGGPKPDNLDAPAALLSPAGETFGNALFRPRNARSIEPEEGRSASRK